MSPLSIILSLSLAALAAANNLHNQGTARRSSHLNRSSQSQSLVKRKFSGHATYFADGLGACGGYSKPGDYIVALNQPQYGGGQDCGRTIVISGLGKTATATIADECPGCPYGCLDMSQGLFEHFAPTSVGEFQITWDWAGAGDDTPTSTKEPPPPPTTTHHSTTTHSTASTTPTTSAAPSTTSASSSAPHASNTPNNDNSGATANVATGGNIADTQKLVYIFGNIATYGKSASTSS